MTRTEAVAALQRALEISRELAAVADGGDLALTVSLDAERLQLLKSARAALQPMDENDRAVLREIAALNDRALGLYGASATCQGARYGHAGGWPARGARLLQHPDATLAALFFKAGSHA